MNKRERQQLMRHLMKVTTVSKQTDFVNLLAEQGIEVTQATVSRDISEMQLVKVPAEGGFRYAEPAQKRLDAQLKFEHTLRTAYVSIDHQDKNVLIKVLPGNGPALASLVDQINDNAIFGTLGDDNTVLIICKTTYSATQLANNIKTIAE
ncbi:arginine repressor [Levilactobacillus bambusae]|uniref:Arginine repressor n=1 Tax=Levilactobacillus bambusae TaxID=2024736 RepID=A0A2V1N4Y3_9LACO|nr:ArgR family transcriptional regulator [Levilactobacillus bambusae]PWG00926.1 ArgR family transcriptional regulator [Levilactobacillus bambusae]